MVRADAPRRHAPRDDRPPRGCGRLRRRRGDGRDARDVEGTLPAATTAEAPASTLEGDASNGKSVFASAGCGGCHTLEAAGSSGTVGPNLDEAKPDFNLAHDRVTNGFGAMPSFKGQLSEQEIADVAQFVAESTQ